MAGKTIGIEARIEFEQALKKGLVTKPIAFKCTTCDGPISSGMPWICGYCGKHNVRTSLYSLLYQCQHCDCPPKACKCPKCAEIVFLDSDRDPSSPAERVAPPEPAPRHLKTVDTEGDATKAFLATKTSLEREIEIAQLTARLATLRDSTTPPATPTQRAQKDLGEYFESLMGGYITAREFRLKAAEQFKDDPDLVSKADDVIQRWLEERMT